MSAVVKDVMSTYPISVTRTMSFKELAARLRESGMSGFPVVDDNRKVIGVVSEADILVKEGWADSHHGWRGMVAAAWHRRERRKAGGVTAGDLMTSPAVTVIPEDTIEHAAALMYAHGFRRLPVVDPAGRLAGVISRNDVLSVFDRPDEEIRAEIIDQVIPRLSEPSWYSVIVRDGIVTVEGTPETVAIGHEVLAQARLVQGVVAVRDRLVYPVPLVTVPGPYSTSDRWGRD
jgi:CBS domain-containing protein